ncbi:NAD(+) synthase [Phyllobacterium salinisoli]|uniref:NH(3)-dependent NAD(+) synthetase n=1 Tax=Phyllobacterium salinisoli TaxID=1899321 RepID=A0A368K0E4_9HYPH|nr:NAD(+) synthase [Phyllobacterium salinisoli]RCS22868.1 NAD(+) synthase [Phyllobacterium salinisoli]
MKPEAATSFSAAALAIDPAAETERIAKALREQLRSLRKRGLVLGVSGGIDSSVSTALAARALGAQNVCCLFMPENDSDPESLRLGRLVAETFGIEGIVEDIGPALLAMGCYERRDSFIRKLVPEYGPGWASKIVISNALEGTGYNISWLVVQDPQGRQSKHRMTPEVYLGIVAATNMKQRTRKQIEYYHADRLNFAVIGTPNRLEYDQGFFVKNGDGAADVKPIAHLYKSQVYQLAEYLGVPEDVRRRPPTTDTYSLAQTQEEFYFSLPYDRMDLCLYGLNHDIPVSAVAEAASLTGEQVRSVWADIAAKRKATRYLHLQPLLVEKVGEVAA